MDSAISRERGCEGRRPAAATAAAGSRRARHRAGAFAFALASALGLFAPAGAFGQGSVEIVYSFTVPPSGPQASLLVGSDGNLYGATSGGGGQGAGAVFKMDTSGNTTVLHVFYGDDGAAPLGRLVETGGFFYGTTSTSGAHGYGTAFRVDASGNFTSLHDFDSVDGTNPQAGLALGSDGNFYGTTQNGGANTFGTVFKMTPAGVVTVLHDFNGSDGVLAAGGLVAATDGKLYGTTEGGGMNSAGTIFRIDIGGSAFAKIHDFDVTHGGDPRATLIQATDGKLYGTTYGGGANSSGTIFRIDTAGTNFSDLHDFTVAEGGAVRGQLYQGADGKLYGTTEIGGVHAYGSTYRMDLAGTNFTTLHSFDVPPDGSLPYAGLVQASDGNFYGTTANNGAQGGGTAFRMVPAGTVTHIHSFGGFGSGSDPEAGLVQASDGNLYGTTYVGGTAYMGTIYKLTPAGSYTLLHSFAGQPGDGAYPRAKLVQGTDGKLYGTTTTGGANDFGTVFRIDTAGTNFTVLHSFDDAAGDGTTPIAALLQATDGKFYGVASQGGGAGGFGTLFRIDTAGTFAKLHDFTQAEAIYPVAPLIQATDGNLYGTSSSGGTATAQGTVFRATLAGAVTAIHTFDGTDGDTLQGGLIQAPDGNLYGTTRGGGAHLEGTVFKMTTAGALTTLHDFNITDGFEPVAGLVRASDGKLYGTTYSGGPSGIGGKGTVFRIDTAGGSFATLHSFTGPDGAGAGSPLIQAVDGELYGTANRDGPGGGGVVYRLPLCQAPVASSNSPVCAGGTIQLSATTVPGATYSWTGPGGFTSSAQNPTRSSATVAMSGTYSVTATVGGCTSQPATTSVTVQTCTVQPAALAVDAAGNSVFEPGESVVVSPSWKNLTGSPLSLTGTASAFAGPAGATYTIADAAAAYGSIASGATASCTVTANCYGLTISNPATRPQLHWDASFLESASTGDTKTWVLHVGNSFTDVPKTSGVYRFVETLLHRGVTAGCGGTSYCPAANVSRQQMAVFLLTSKEGSGYSPPPCTTPVFTDVPCSSGFAKWIDELAARGVTAGCGGGNYCPLADVTRGQMAVFLLRTLEGPSYTPPACVTPTFTDVPCSSGLAPWIDELAARGITAGCGGGLYCPGSPVTRGQMAVFLTTTFALTLYGP